jgi:hypothetical protein
MALRCPRKKVFSIGNVQKRTKDGAECTLSVSAKKLTTYINQYEFLLKI